MSREETLRKIIDELKYENRKMEFSSVINKLIKRIERIEEHLNIDNKS
jgi:hypothetical protein